MEDSVRKTGEIDDNGRHHRGFQVAFPCETEEGEIWNGKGQRHDTQNKIVYHPRGGDTLVLINHGD